MRTLHWHSEMKQSCSYCIYLTHLLCHEIYFRFSGGIGGHAAETGSGSRSPSGRTASQDYTSKQQSPGLFSVDKTPGRQFPIFKFRLNRKIGCTTPADGRQFDRAVLKPICSNTSATPLPGGSITASKSHQPFECRCLLDELELPHFHASFTFAG
jgi:hypothetical protein